MSKTNTSPSSRSKPAYRLRRSPVHGTGLFATRPIRKGTGIIEYVGERISHEEADRRHEDKDADDNHTFLFTVDSKIVIDGGVDGNAARFINHSCEPNCEVIIDDGRLFVEALRTIRPGEEVVYDYNIGRTSDDPPNVDKVFACRCGTPSCRGTMLAPVKKSKASKGKAASKASKGKAASKTSKGKTASKTSKRKAAPKTSKGKTASKTSKRKAAPKTSKRKAASKQARKSS